MGAKVRLPFLLLLAMTATAQTAPDAPWTLRLADRPDPVLRAIASEGRIEFRNADTVAFTIPIASVVEVFHATHRYQLWGHAPATRRPGDDEPVVTPVDVSALISAIAAPPPSYSKGHYVRITWDDNGRRDALLELNGDSVGPFLQWLDQLTGTAHRDLDTERDNALRQIEHRKAEAFHIVLRYPARHGGAPAVVDSLVVPVEMYGGTGLFFFHREVKAKNLFWILPVMGQPSKNECVREVEVQYGKCDFDACDVRAVLLPTMTYRPQTARERITDLAVSDCERLRDEQVSEDEIPVLHERPVSK